jgi:alkanesulfonate monooxygenase SsuD/methylene tetrahydromethanopterin reductase-like flavin-dependent oxidoreductase (luciferase family)
MSSTPAIFSPLATLLLRSYLLTLPRAKEYFAQYQSLLAEAGQDPASAVFALSRRMYVAEDTRVVRQAARLRTPRRQPAFRKRCPSLPAAVLPAPVPQAVAKRRAMPVRRWHQWQ